MIVCAIGSLSQANHPKDVVLVFVFAALYVATSIGADIGALREDKDSTKEDV